MAFPTTSILDNFNRSNEGPPPSSSWTNFSNGLEVYSNECRGDASGAGNISYWETSYGPDCEGYFTVLTSYSQNTAIYARFTTGGDGYQVSIDGPDDEIKIIRDDDFVDTQLGATMSIAPASGDAFGIECIGSTIKAYRKPSGGSWGDISSGGRTDGTYGSSGLLVVYIFSTYTIDDFGGGNVVTAPSGGPRGRAFKGPFVGPFRGSLE